MDRIEEFLKNYREYGLLRMLKPAGQRVPGKISFKNKEYIDFSSNDYLGLSGHARLKEVFSQACRIYGVGACASRLLSGDLDLHHQLEEKTAGFKGKESALVFNSGYQANIGIISSFCRRQDVIFSDKLSHASIIDGALLSGAKMFRFRHNDLNHLEILLKTQRRKFKNALIVTETIFSMDGDKAPLEGLVSLKDKYSCSLMVDEAHATGIFGRKGSGLLEEEGLTERIDIVMGTFSKALAGFGAYVAVDKSAKEYLINTCRSFIYSTALPAAVIAVNLASLDLVDSEPFRRQSLLRGAQYLRIRLKELGFTVKGCSQIIPLILGSVGRTVHFSKKLQDKGYWVCPIRPPTVSQNEARLRFSLTCNHNREVLDRLIKDIHEASKQEVR